ncbi:MAG: acyl-CoA thioesterase [Clostridia bacterium]|nr:acyl-CoA thioesterase [Clostridia bacterium]
MFAYKRKAQYHETDQMGMIHHSNYVKWMEEARLAFMESLGMSYDKVEEMGIISPVVSIGVEYVKPVRYNEDMIINVGVKKYTGVRLELEYEMIEESTGELRTRASSSHCFIRNGRIISLKKELPEIDRTLKESV